MNPTDPTSALTLAISFMGFAGGAMALIGGTFTFVNGRLNEATTPERKIHIVDWIIKILAAIFFLAGGISSFFTFVWILPFYTAGIILDVILFLRLTRPLNRWDVIMLSVLLSASHLSL
jgi:uncharacterized membrane protein HdeD (DUF308 family)